MIYLLDTENNPANVKQADLTIHFNDGVSESQSANELFTYMSRYVQARENLEYCREADI